MKRLSFISLFSVLALSTLAHAELVGKGCYVETDKKFGNYITSVEVHSDEVIVNFTSAKHGNLGSYRGRILSSSAIKKTAQSVSVGNLTLNDGADGYLDKVKIEITNSTVTFDSSNSVVGPKQKVQCP